MYFRYTIKKPNYKMLVNQNKHCKHYTLTKYVSFAKMISSNIMTSICIN